MHQSGFLGTDNKNQTQLAKRKKGYEGSQNPQGQWEIRIQVAVGRRRAQSQLYKCPCRDTVAVIPGLAVWFWLAEHGSPACTLCLIGRSFRVLASTLATREMGNSFYSGGGDSSKPRKGVQRCRWSTCRTSRLCICSTALGFRLPLQHWH